MASLSAILLLVDLATGESAYGSFANWGEVYDANLAFLEDAVGEVTSKAVTTLDVTLTADEERSLVIKATGALTGNRSILTNDRKGFWFVSNETTGAFTLTFKPTSGTGIVVPRGARWALYCDGTNIYRVGSKAPTCQIFTGSGTWTNPGCQAVIVEAIGGGGAGGGSDGQGAGTAGAGGGGSAGFGGTTDVIDVSQVASGAVTIGAGGAAGAAGSANGGNGGDTSIVLGSTTYTWGGGPGGVGNTATAPVRMWLPSGSPTGTNVRGGGWRGEGAFSSGDDVIAQSGEGGRSPYGMGGFPQRFSGGSAVSAGANATSTNYGSGGSGGFTIASASDVAGGTGAGGFMRVWEFY